MKINLIKITKYFMSFVVLPIVLFYVAMFILLYFAHTGIHSPDVYPKHSKTKTKLYIPSEIINIKDFYLGNLLKNSQNKEDTILTEYITSQIYNNHRLFDECLLGKDDSSYVVWINLKKYFALEDTSLAKNEINYLIKVLQHTYSNNLQIYKTLKSYDETNNIKDQYKIVWKINKHFELFEFQNIYDVVNLKLTYYQNTKKNMLSSERVPHMSIELEFALNGKDTYFEKSDSLTLLKINDINY